MRVVEGEVPGGRLFHGEAVVGADKVLAEQQVGALSLSRRHQNQSGGHLGSRLNRLPEPADSLRIDHQTVHHDLDVVLLVLVEADALGQFVEVAVDAGPHEAGLARVGQDVLVLALPAAHYRGQDHDARTPGKFKHSVRDLFGSLPGDHVPADGAVRNPDPGVHQPQVVIDLGDGPHGRTRVVARPLLID